MKWYATGREDQSHKTHIRILTIWQYSMGITKNARKKAAVDMTNALLRQDDETDLRILARIDFFGDRDASLDFQCVGRASCSLGKRIKPQTNKPSKG